MNAQGICIKKVVASRGIEPQKQDFKVNCSMVANLYGIKKVVARDGIEPPTQGFSVPCSTN